ncbi:histidine phosphatase superfamily [Trichoderma sp. SZMC 28014]
MPPTIVLIRHAQALHNEAKDHSIPDPRLTDLGLQQCAQLRQNLVQRFSSFEGKIAIVASPMMRTLQTASLAADWLVERGIKIEADADWQENSDKPCDTGSPPSHLVLIKDNHTKIQFTSPSFDYSTIHPLWPDKTSSPAARSLFGYTRSAVLDRARRALEKLRQRPEDLIFVFSHSAFMRTAVTGWWYFNADYRIFEFDDEGKDGAVVPLRMDQSTLEGGMGWSWAKRVEVGYELPDGPEEES